MEFSGQALTRARGSETQESLAAKAGVSVFTISRLESGRHEPTLTTLAKLAGALDIDIEELLVLEDGAA